MESFSVGVFWVTESLSLCYLHTTFTLWQIHYNHVHGIACAVCLAICDVHPTSSSRSLPFGFCPEAAACSSLSLAAEPPWARIFLSLSADVQRLGHKGSVCSWCGSWQVSGSLLGPQEARTLLPWRGKCAVQPFTYSLTQWGPVATHSRCLTSSIWRHKWEPVLSSA